VKKIIFLLLTFFLSGCATHYPLTANLSLEIGSQPGQLYTGDTTASLRGHDARKDPAVVVYRLKNEPEVRIPNESAPQNLVTEQLAAGLEEQGLVFAKGSPVYMELEINELAATVTRPEFLYSAKAKSYLSLTVNNRGTKLTKSYKREADRQSATRPTVVDLEKMLNSQLNEIVKQILQDEELRNTIRKM
jgi:uncharacterized lipoprotein